MNDTIDLILRSVNIVDIVKHYIPLKKSGMNYKARCPFHEEKTASFNVNETKQMFKCFGCGKGGNAITFVIYYEKISFPEALSKISDLAGIPIPKFDQAKKDTSKKELIYTVYELANDFFVKNFVKYGMKAKKYLEKRNIPNELIEEFSIGYSLDSYTALRSHLQRNAITADIFPKTGLFRTNEKGDLSDLFFDRLMFPIKNVTGRVVAFGGRSLNEEEKHFKYINSPTTDIYTKGKELYGLHITRFEIGKQNCVFICEGYLDFLRLYQKGIRNSVASLGTALTKEQISLLSRYTKNIYLIFDGDIAGKKSAVKAASLITQLGYHSHIILLPEKHDPDSYLLENTIEEFNELVFKALPLAQFVQKEYQLYGSIREAIQALIDVSLDIEDAISRELFLKEISETFTISEINQHKYSRVKSIQKQNNDAKKSDSYKYEEEKKLIKYMLNYPEMSERIAEKIDTTFFINDDLKKIFEHLISLNKNEIIDNPAILIERLNNAENMTLDIINELTHLFFEEDFLDNIDDLIRQVKLRKYTADLIYLNKSITEQPNNNILLENKLAVKEEISKLSKKVVRNTMSE